MSVWGVDSATNVTKSLYNCVLKNFGKPEYWGRYLSTVAGAAEGLTQQEVDLLHSSGTKVLPIYNDFRAATGRRQGRVTAQNAAFHAKRVGIPDGTVLFANVENFFEVDADWIIGYVNAMYPSGYKAGFYNDPEKGGFRNAYCQAVSRQPEVANQSILWSSEPDPGVTKRREAPMFRPSKPTCRANVWGWQYGRNAETCPIDTNLITIQLYNILW